MEIADVTYPRVFAFLDLLQIRRNRKCPEVQPQPELARLARLGLARLVFVYYFFADGFKQLVNTLFDSFC